MATNNVLDFCENSFILSNLESNNNKKTAQRKSFCHMPKNTTLISYIVNKKIADQELQNASRNINSDSQFQNEVADLKY